MVVTPPPVDESWFAFLAEATVAAWEWCWGYREQISLVTGLGALLGGMLKARRTLQELAKRALSSLASRPTATAIGLPAIPTTAGDHFPHNLPARHFFVGRSFERQALRELVVQLTPFIVILGPAGNGKTALLLEELHRCAQDAERDSSHLNRQSMALAGIVYLSAKGRRITLPDVHEAIIRVTGELWLRQLDPAERTNEVVALLRRRRYIVALDNFETVQDKDVSDFLATVPEPSTVIITTRHAVFRQQYPTIDVHALPSSDAVELVEQQSRRVGVKGFDSDHPRSVGEILDATGRSPLAIKWALGQMRERGETLAGVVSRLKAASSDIFEDMFDHSWDLLDRRARDVLKAFVVFGGSVTRSSLYATVGLGRQHFDRAVGRLIGLSLVECEHSDRNSGQVLSVHSLVRAFATTRVSPREVAEIRLKAAHHFLEIAKAWRSGDDNPDLPHMIEADTENACLVVEALASIAANHKGRNSYELDNLVVGIADALSVFLWSRGLWDRRVRLSTLGIEAAKRTLDFEAAGRFSYFIGIVRFWQQKFVEAEEWRDQSAASLGHLDRSLQSLLPNRLDGLICIGRGEFLKAREKLTDVLERLESRSSGHEADVRVFADWVCVGREGWKAGYVSLMQEVGIALNASGTYDDARTWLERSLTLAISISDVEGASVSHSHLGHALRGLGRLSEARRQYELGLTAARSVRRASTTYRCLQGLAVLADTEADQAQATALAAEAAEGFRRLGMESERLEMAALLGNLSQANQVPPPAR